jgi:hypothetical protein
MSSAIASTSPTSLISSKWNNIRKVEITQGIIFIEA